MKADELSRNIGEQEKMYSNIYTYKYNKDFFTQYCFIWILTLLLYVFNVIRIIIIFIILNLNLFLRPLNYSLGVTSWCKGILWQLLAHIKRSERWDNFCIDHEQYYVIISIVLLDAFWWNIFLLRKSLEEFSFSFL